MRPIEVRLTGRFKFQSKLQGEHEFTLYRGVHMQTNERLIMKGEEHKNAKPKRSSLSLLQEGKIYQSMQGGIGVPYMYWCGQEEDYNFLVLQQLQATLSGLLARCGGKFSLKTAMMIGMELVPILQYFHFKHYVYNNICPKHILLGKGQKYGELFIVDYSKAFRYRDPQLQDHVAEPIEKNYEMRFVNMQFSSFNYHKGITPTRRDDMQSLLYLISFLMNGELPWSSEMRNMKKTQFQKCRYVAELKESNKGKLFKEEPELQSLLNYTLSLKFDQKPQYAYFISAFNRILEKHDMIDDRMFDWMFLEDDDEIGELNHKFQLYEGEQEMLEKISSDEVQKKLEPVQIKPNSKIQQKVPSNSKKNDKQCLIY